MATAEISFIALETPTTLSASPLDEGSRQDDAVPVSSTPAQATPGPRPRPTLPPPERIVAPVIGLDAPVVPVRRRVVDVDGQAMVMWDVADYAAGWHEDSARPGEPGNIVLSGHHNVKGKVFQHIAELEEGDEIILYAGGQPHQYVVQRKMILKEKGEPLEVRQRNARWIGPTSDERLTLVTCWPYISNTHRVIVVARPRKTAEATPRPTPPVEELGNGDWR